MGRIVVGVDGSETSRQALAWAVDEAARRDATVEAVHAWHLPYAEGFAFTSSAFDPTLYESAARDVLTADIAAVEGAAAVVEPVVVHGAAAPMLLERAAGADLLVVGTRGRGGFAGLLLGSVSHQLVQHAPCPVVVVPAAPE
jgi:nucleotide-binding universal stress UspA family protein